ncbi:hypothetical protein QR685DRAFT_552199 [Neurospora intermedia]|uniref:Uncharacterized protein n=1 Tax=Neurospora intermedia TaxID=5142 RepID=A0ABR3DIM0_NEUIN
MDYKSKSKSQSNAARAAATSRRCKHNVRRVAESLTNRSLPGEQVWALLATFTTFTIPTIFTIFTTLSTFVISITPAVTASQDSIGL